MRVHLLKTMKFLDFGKICRGAERAIYKYSDIVVTCLLEELLGYILPGENFKKLCSFM